jgi:hypothetical protein
VICIRWILPFAIILNIISWGIRPLLSKLGFPNWEIIDGIAMLAALAGTILVFMGYKHLKLFFLPVNRNNLIYHLEKMLNLLKKLNKLKKKQPKKISSDKENSLDRMILDLDKVLMQEKEKREEYEDQKPFWSWVMDILIRGKFY